MFDKDFKYHYIINVQCTKRNTFFIVGLVARVTGVIDWTADITAAEAASSAVISGGTFNLPGAPGYRVVCTIEVENWTKYPLMAPDASNNGGIIKSPPVVVLPGQREQFVSSIISLHVHVLIYCSFKTLMAYPD